MRRFLIHFGPIILGIATCGLGVLAGASSLLAQSPPDEVTGLRWCAGSSACLEWTPVTAATQYRVYRGGRTNLPCALNSTLDSCVEGAYTTSNTGVTIHDTPAQGQFFWFVVTALNSGGEGSPGTATSGP